jgi:branched-chain amino acid transport system ATP-binding protein
VLELNSVTAGYGKMVVLEDITLHCGDNEVVLVFGPNGAGKTTMLQTIYRFADLHQGAIRYNGEDLAKYYPHDMLSLGIGYMWQRGGFFPSMTVRDNFRMALRSLKDYDLSDKLEQTFRFFPRLQQKLEQTAITLSGGEKKMLAVACVLAQDPNLLLVDEVSEDLQPQLRDSVIDIIANLVREKKKAAILVEEPTEKVLQIADRAYCLRDGAIVAEGPAKDFLNKADLEELYFGKA